MGNCCWPLQKYLKKPKVKAEASIQNQDKIIIHQDISDQNDGYQVDDETGDVLLPSKTSLRARVEKMGFSDRVSFIFKKLGCISEPRVQESTYTTLQPDQADGAVTVQGASHIQSTEKKVKEIDLKGETIKDISSEPKEDEDGESGEEKPKSEEACVVASEIREGEESKSDQAVATVPSQRIQEEQIATAKEAETINK